MITRALLFALACLVALVGAAPAQAFTLGIGDQSTRMIDDPRFQALGVRHTRIVVPYNMMSDPTIYDRYAYVLHALHAQDIDVLVAFNHRVDSHTYLPSVATYRRNFRAFRRAFPWITEYSPWNEANHSSQPTARRPDRAAAYYNAVRADCAGCDIVAADVLDQRGFEEWIRAFRRRARAPKLWGLHNYADVNRLKDTTVPRMRRATGGGRLWLTETGGIVRLAMWWPYDERRAARATKHVLKLARRRGIPRVYLYRWTGEPLGSRWDSGLIAFNGRARPALNVVEAHLGKARTQLPPIPRIAKYPRPRNR
jgi:hypothetical protein